MEASMIRGGRGSMDTSNRVDSLRNCGDGGGGGMD